jgi:hypothetical protein
MTIYDDRYLRALTDERLRTASSARVGRAGLRVRRALRGAEAAHRKAVRADLRAIEARSRLSGTASARMLPAR